MYIVFWIIGVVPPGYYLPLIPLIPLLTCIWALQTWMSDPLFPFLAAVCVVRFFAILFRRVAVKLRVPTMVNCFIDRALILPLFLIVMDLTVQISLITPLISLKRLLWRSSLPRS